ncbi:Flp pilus assembly complex ATPase component TadA [bacterium]|nr:Flp pilus assembly complex ATPase component TadA [bacterium]
MSDISFRCPHCQAALSVEASAAGQDVRCPKCKGTLTIPRSSREAAQATRKGANSADGRLDLAPLGGDLAARDAPHPATAPWLVRGVYGLSLVLALAVLWLRGDQVFYYVAGLTADEFWIKLKNPFYVLVLLFNALTAVLALYVMVGASGGLRGITTARQNLITGLTWYLVVMILHVVLLTYMAYRSSAFIPTLRSEAGWLAASVLVGGTLIYVLSQLPSLRLDRKFALSESDGIELVQSLMAKAAHARASDLHLEPTPEGGVVRFRVDGLLYPVTTFPTAIAERIVSRVKVMSLLDIAEKRLPQDGQTMFSFGGKEIDLRVSTVPTAHGERLVVRFLDREHGLLGMDQLGMAPEILRRLEKVLRSPHGVFFCTGPTGAGKSTTLYSALMSMNKTDRNIITVEDPIEFQIPGITQLPVSKKKGMTFASGLRSILRQDPDVIMVGEVRDAETAHMCIQAAQTGHLVLSTVHTNDAAGAVARMLDLGSEPFLLASSLRAVLAQRLVRRVCPACSMPYEPSAEDLADLGLAADIKGDFRKGRGCPKCLSTGYYGRVGLFELLVVDDNIRKLINDRADAYAIRDAAMAEGMVTLRADGIAKARAGVTTIEEVLRVTAADVM